MQARRTQDPIAHLAADVARQAPALGLGLAEDGPDLSKMIGVAFMAAAHTTIGAGAAKAPKTKSAGDAAAIKKLVASWTSLHPRQLLARWTSLAINPYTVVGAGAARQVNTAYLKKWLKSKELASFMKTFPFHAVRQVKLAGVKITWLGASTACVTWSETETAKNGRHFKGNAVAIVVRTAKGWRIAVTSKQGVYSA